MRLFSCFVGILIVCFGECLFLWRGLGVEIILDLLEVFRLEFFNNFFKLLNGFFIDWDWFFMLVNIFFVVVWCIIILFIWGLEFIFI